MTGADFTLRPPPGDERGATFCRPYRYQLWRRWDRTAASVVWIMLNPSIADAKRNDPTVTRCMGFADRWGFGGIIVCNVFAYISTDPRALADVADPVGPENECHIVEAVEQARAVGAPVVAGWGDSIRWPGQPQALADHVRTFRDWLADAAGAQCLGRTLSGNPRHPLYVRGSVPLQPLGVS